MSIKGYKVFNPDWTCRGFQYKVGETFVHNGDIEMCGSGFHFCRKASDCFSYYDFNSNNKVAEVEAIGLDETRGDKSVTDKIKIVREIKWMELLTIVNEGNNCTGLCNSGDYNSGDHNSGDYNSGDHNSGNYNSGNWNSGDHNSGNYNSGYYNSGYYNSGNYNSGDHNSGNYNSGNYNSGYRNSGYYNSGYYNSGNYNSGDHNSGNYNSGNYNSGYRNSGYYNSGYYNSGNYNSGDHNSGNYNSGNWNSTNYSTGFLNSEQQPIYMFNQPTNMQREEVYNLAGIQILNRNFKNSWWIYSENMSAEEKAAHPEHETTGGYLKTVDFKTACKIMWDNLDEEDKEAVRNLPNFDNDVFREITGISVEGENEQDK
jgi:hypothetical protein